MCGGDFGVRGSDGERDWDEIESEEEESSGGWGEEDWSEKEVGEGEEVEERGGDESDSLVSVTIFKGLFLINLMGEHD